MSFIREVLHTEGKHVDAVVYGTYDSEHQYSGKADEQADARAAIASECGYRAVILVDEHGLYYKQVIIQRNHRIDKCYEYEDVETLLEGSREDEELREEACERRYSCK